MADLRARLLVRLTDGDAPEASRLAAAWRGQTMRRRAPDGRVVAELRVGEQGKPDDPGAQGGRPG